MTACTVCGYPLAGPAEFQECERLGLHSQAGWEYEDRWCWSAYRSEHRGPDLRDEAVARVAEMVRLVQDSVCGWPGGPVCAGCALKSDECEPGRRCLHRDAPPDARPTPAVSAIDLRRLHEQSGDSGKFERLRRAATDAELNMLRERVAELEHHYEAAGPEHNLMALLDLYEGRARKAEERVERLEGEAVALALSVDLYASPDSYLGIAFVLDRPCGAFADDFSETEDGSRPGKLAREVLVGLGVDTAEACGDELRRREELAQAKERIAELEEERDEARAEIARRDGIGFGGVKSGSDLEHFMTAMCDALQSSGCESPLDAAKRLIRERDESRQALRDLQASMRETVEEWPGWLEMVAELEATRTRAERAERDANFARTDFERAVGERDSERDAAHTELAKSIARSARLEVALIGLISSIISSGCRDDIVWRDIEAARLAIRGGQ